MNRYHLEILIKSADKQSCICRIYRFTDEKIRQIVNEEVNSFKSMISEIVNIGCKGIDIEIREEDDNKFAYLINWLNIPVPFPIESCRVTKFTKTDKISHHTTALIKGKMLDNISKMIDLENRKYKDTI